MTMCEYCNNPREAEAADYSLARQLRRLADKVTEHAPRAAAAKPDERHTEGPLLWCAQDTQRTARSVLRGMVMGDWI